MAFMLLFVIVMLVSIIRSIVSLIKKEHTPRFEVFTTLFAFYMFYIFVTKMFDGTLPTVVYTACEKSGKFGKNVEQVVLDFAAPLLPQILSHLNACKIDSLLVEGGATVLQSFINASLWDEARVEVNPSLELGSGVVAPSLAPCQPYAEESLAGNRILRFHRLKTP